MTTQPETTETLDRISFTSAGAVRKEPVKRLSDEELAERFRREMEE